MAKPKPGNVTPIGNARSAKKKSAGGAKPPARKSRAHRDRGADVPPVAQTKRAAIGKPASTGPCATCGGAENDHLVGCPKYACLECGMHAGNHTSACSENPEGAKPMPAPARRAARAKTPVFDGTTGGTIADAEAIAQQHRDADVVAAANDRLEERDDEIEDARERGEDVDADESDDDEKPKKRPRRILRPPEITAEDVRVLQQAINDRKLVMFSQPRSMGVICAHFATDAEGEIGCGELAGVRLQTEDECPSCGKLDKEVFKNYCIAHGALFATGNLKAPQLEFDL